MSSGRRRGRPKRKAQRRAKWQHERRFSKRTKRQSPSLVRDEETAWVEHTIRTLAGAGWLKRPEPLHADDYVYYANGYVPDGHPESPYRKEA